MCLAVLTQYRTVTLYIAPRAKNNIGDFHASKHYINM